MSFAGVFSGDFHSRREEVKGGERKCKFVSNLKLSSTFQSSLCSLVLMNFLIFGCVFECFWQSSQSWFWGRSAEFGAKGHLSAIPFCEQHPWKKVPTQNKVFLNCKTTTIQPATDLINFDTKYNNLCKSFTQLCTIHLWRPPPGYDAN